MKEKIAMVIPTVRMKLMKEKFLPAWKKLFDKHEVTTFIIDDFLDNPVLHIHGPEIDRVYMNPPEVIINKNDGVRNWGLLMAYRLDFDIVISLDDDVLPVGDTIQDHIDALNMKKPLGWINTAEDIYVRGVPYGVREEAQVMVSHGVWNNVPDMDGPSQLVNGIPKHMTFYKGVIPKGVLMPFCAMNFALRREAIPYAYQAPMVDGYNRFADIWGGIELKKTCDQKGWAMVTGYSYVWHERASNVFKNIQREALGLEANENYGKAKIFEKFFKYRNKFIKLCRKK